MNFARLLVPACLGCFASIAQAAPIKHNYDLQNVLWKLSFSMDGGTISGDVTNTVTLSEDTSTVQFHCGQLQISKVTVNGSDATFDTSDDKLTVNLPTAAKAGQKLDVRTIYTGTPARGFYFVAASRAFPAKTGMVYTQGEGEDNHFWVPTYDYPDDKATSECFVTVPKSWTAISNGSLVGVGKDGDNKVFHWKMPLPYSTYLISLVAGPYVQVRDHWKNIPVDFYVPPGLEAEGRASFRETPRMIDLYSELTGVDYPWPKFAQETVGDFMFGGMENVSCVTQTIRTLHPPATEPLRDSTYLVAHELAHQWFGDLITCKTWEHTWLNEGFATTLPTFYTRLTRGQDAFDLDRYGNLEGAIDTIGSRGRKDVPGTVGSVPTVTMGSPYPGGCSRILLLMHMLGEETFWKGIHAFLDKYKFQPATTDDFFQVMRVVSGRDLSAFESQWFHSAATPSLTASVENGSLIVSQLQPYYKLTLPVWVLNGDQWNKLSIDINGAKTVLPIDGLGAKPFLIDPESWIPMELKYQVTFSPSDVMALYRHAPNAAQKARIIAGLFDSAPVADRIAAGREEKVPGLLQMIAGHIGQEGEDYLVELLGNKNRKVADTAITALGHLKGGDKAKLALKAISANDPNEALREHASQVLLDWSNDGAFAKSLWTMKAFDDGYRAMAMTWYGKHDPDYARKLALEVLANPDSEPLRVVSIRVLGDVKESGASHDVYDALIKVAQENSYAARIAAIGSLGKIGNKAAIEVLQPFTTHGPDAVEGTAKATIEALTKT